MMKYIVAVLLLAQVAAFTTVAPSARAQTLLAAEYEKKEGEGKINLMVSVSSGERFLVVPASFRPMASNNDNNNRC